MLFDERPELPGLAAMSDELERTLAAGSGDRVELYREAMDLSRFGSKTYESVLRDTLRAKYADKKIDVVVAFYPGALDFLLTHGSEIFPGAPIVFCGIDRRELGDRSLPPDVHGVLVKREFAPTVEIALRIHPDTKQITVVAGTSEFDAGLLDYAREEFRAYEDRVAFRYLTKLPLRELLGELRKLPPKTLVLFTSLFRDGAGEPFVTHNVVPLVSAAANAPLYGFIDQYIGRGIVGGSLYSLSKHGSEAAKLVLQVLANPQSGGPSLIEVPTRITMFDWRQMQRWGISESSLPPGSELRFRDLTIWSQYRTPILAVIAAFLLQSALIAWLIYEQRRRHLAEVQARQSMAELTQLNRLATAGELSAAIAHEVKQPITGMVTMANAAVRWLSRESPDIGRARDLLNKVVAAGHNASEVITNVRGLFGKDTQEKTPCDVNNLIRTVLALVYIDLRKYSIETQVNLSEQLPPVIGNAVQLQQVILNLVMNAIESMVSAAEPRVLSITSKSNEHNTVLVSIADTGSGIDVANLSLIFKPMFTTKARGMGMGLSICKSIIESHNGQIWVSAGALRGSIFNFELPVRQGGEGKSDLSDPTPATHSPAPAPSLTDEMIE
jgi:signal transduction histidine kinase